MDSDGEDSDSELYSKNTTHLNILHVEYKFPFLGLNYSYNYHASTPIAENWTDITTSELERFCKAATQISQRNDCYLLTLTQQRKEHIVDFS